MKSTLVDALIAHESTPWGEGCRAKLEAFDEAMLEQMLASFESSEPDQEESTADDTPEPEVNAQDEAQTSREVQEFINRLIPKETLEFIETQNSRAKQHRQTLEQGVKTRYGLSESSIAAMSLADLESLASSMPVVNYSGKGAPVMAHVEEDENPPPPVVMRERKVPDGN